MRAVRAVVVRGESSDLSGAGFLKLPPRASSSAPGPLPCLLDPLAHPRPASRPSRVPCRRFAPLTARPLSPVPPSPWTTATRKGAPVEPPPTRSDLSTLAGNRLFPVPAPAPRWRLPPRARGSRNEARLVQRTLRRRGEEVRPHPAALDPAHPVGVRRRATGCRRRPC